MFQVMTDYAAPSVVGRRYFGKRGLAHRKVHILPIKFGCPLSAVAKMLGFSSLTTPLMFSDPLRFEAVTEKIDGLAIGQRCKIHVEKTESINVG